MSTFHSIDANAAKALLDKQEAVLIDVREPAEYEAEHIPDATLIPLATIHSDQLKKFSGKKIIIHCKLGQRGIKACEKLAEANPNIELYNIEGGITAWTHASLPTIKSGKSFISIDRQVQITIGGGVLLGVILGFILSPAFFFLSAFFGAGLLYAGLTGTCGLALMMAKMPWNKSSKTHCSH